MIYRGTVRGGVIVLDSPAQLPEGLTVDVAPVAIAPDLLENPIDPAFLIGDLAVETGIPDLAANIDHYLYGHPKAKDGD